MQISFKPLKHLLIEKDLSMSELARRMDLKRQSLYRMLNQETLSLKNAIRIANEMDCRVDDIFELEEEKTIGLQAVAEEKEPYGN